MVSNSTSANRYENGMKQIRTVKSIGKSQENSDPSVIVCAFLNKTEPYSRFGHLRSLQSPSFFESTNISFVDS